jgi:hypothetical protein
MCFLSKIRFKILLICILIAIPSIIHSDETMTLTMSDLNINTFDIPILNRYYQPTNYLILYDNNGYVSTNSTNSILKLNNSLNYTISFKPSKLQTLSYYPILFTVVENYYVILLSFVFILVIIMLIKKNL